MNDQTNRRMHSAEHVLNQTMVRHFGCGRAFSAHIGEKKSKCDYRFERAITESEVRDIETAVNDVIGQNLPVTEEQLGREEAARRFSLERLPADAGEILRIVRIGDYDACPCRGGHVGATGEIGGFRIISTDFADGVLRIRYRLDRGKM